MLSRWQNPAPDNLEIWGVQYAPGYKLIMTVVEAKINEKPDQFKTLKLIPSKCIDMKELDMEKFSSR